MSNGRNQLLLAALHRAPKPLTTGEAADAAMGLGDSEGWPKESLERLTRKAVVKLLQHMVASGWVVQCGLQMEGPRSVPTFAPAGARDPDYPIPDAPSAPAPRGKPSVYGDRTKLELITICESYDRVLEVLLRFKNDLEAVTTKEARKLREAGVMDA